MVQVIGFGGSKQDTFHTPPAQQIGQPRIPSRPKRRQNLSECAAQIFQRRRARVDRTQHISQHNLPVNLGKMIPKEGAHNPCLIRLEAASHLPCKATARCFPIPPQGRERQNR